MLHAMSKISSISFILCWIFYCAIGQLVEEQCKRQCNSTLTFSSDEVNLFCNDNCKVQQCHAGCDKYNSALTTSCQQVCGESVVQRQFCTQGCNKALGIYAQEVLDTLDKLPAPELKHGSKSYSSVVLHWSGPVHENITYYIQSRVIDTNSGWQVYNKSTLDANGDVNITGLHPYLTYKFKILLVITTVHVKATQESEDITTLPHGAPSTAPTITDVSAPTPSVISISWKPPIFPNGKVLGYRLKLNPYDHPELHPVNREVPGNISSWTLQQLQSSQLYLITVSAWNSEGEGPADSANITTPNPGNLPAGEMPYLVLGEENKVLKQNMEDWHSNPGHLHTHQPESVFVTGAESLFNASGNVTGVGVHIHRELLLVTDSDGKVHIISMKNHSQDRMDIYPMLTTPVAITVDWLNDQVYVVDGDFIYQCSLHSSDCIVATEQLETTAHDIKVDPINGFLYFTQTENHSGLYRIDLGDFSPTHRATPMQVTHCKLTAFFMDHGNMQLYFPNETQNTILSSFLDGTGLVDLRSGKVVRPNFINITSIVYFRGLFYWTDGTQVLGEDYDKSRDMFYRNSLMFFATHFASFNIYQPKVQPNPVPHSPPRNVQALFTSNKVNIHWQKPQKLSYQGKGAWDKWWYDVSIAERDGVKAVVSQNISKYNLEKTGLLADTVYHIKARACSMVGCGPWSHDFIGRTLPQDASTATVIMSRTKSIMTQLIEVNMYGEIVTKSRMFTDSKLMDVAWNEDAVFFTTRSNRMYSYNRKKGRVRGMFRGEKATSLAYEWLGNKLYWSMENGVIKRAKLDGSAMEFVSQGKEGRALHMAVDSLQGRLYWNTQYSVESSYLNGDDHQVYFSVPLFSGKLVISLTLNFDLKKVFWYVKGFDNQELYTAEMIRDGVAWSDVSVQQVGNFKSIALSSALQYYSHRLFWKNQDNAVVVGDLKCNHTSVISERGMHAFSVYDTSLHTYPHGLDKNNLVIVPYGIDGNTVECNGQWTLFNVTWKQAVLNYGKVFYEVSIKVLDGSMANMKMFQKTENSWYEVSGVPPYSRLSVSLRAYTYWGNGAVTVVEIHSPMSVPGKPQAPRVYVSQYKDMVTSNHALAADFRWTEPDVINGVISHYNVYHWKEGDEVTSVGKAASARHFILAKLMQNSTYYFQVSACTDIGCGEQSDIVSAQADVVNPSPKLLVATDTAVVVAEVDSDLTVTKGLTVLPVAVAYLANNDSVFWITEDNMLMQSVNGVTEELVQLNGTGVDLSLDWISHNLFVVERDQTGGTTTIKGYLLDQKIYFDLQKRPQPVGAIVADPYTSTIIWSESVLSGSHYIIYKMNANQDITVVFHSQRSRRDSSFKNCNCPMSMYVGPQIAIDHSQNDKMEILVYDTTSKYIIATDIDGCHCRNVISRDEVTRTGDGPDLLSVDHLHIYWYSNSDKTLYSVEKSTGKVIPKSMSNVRDFVAYGSQLQPLPGLECMNPGEYNGSIVMVKNSNSSITLLMEEITWPKECDDISHPDTKYTVYYKSGSTGDRCGIGGSDCMSESSYERQITLTGLEPYTEYVVHAAVSNYYNQYLSQVLSEEEVFRTQVGVPTPVTSMNLTVLTSTLMKVTWSPPARPYGPLAEVSYKVKWSVESGGELQEKEKIPEVTIPNNTNILPTHSMILTDLLPDHVYKVKVLASNRDKQWYSESPTMEARTYQTPENPRLVNRTSNSLTVSWKSPSDNSIYYHTFRYRQLHAPNRETAAWKKRPVINTKTKNNTEYIVTFNNLLPYKEYRIHMRFAMMNIKRALDWPPDNNTVYRTLATVPDAPSSLEIVTLRSQGYEVIWTKPVVNGKGIDHYSLQFRTEDSNVWNDAYNGTEQRWVVDRDVMAPGQDYYFRIRAKNEIGWGQYSNSSLVFTFRETQVQDDSVAVIAITLSFVFIIILIIIMAICYVIRRRQQEKRKPTQFVAIARGPDLELATLRELPHTAFQQSNTLYAINIIPTDTDIASLPHFRRDQLMLTKFLGSGAFGEVFEGLAKNILSDSSGETKVAVKTLRKSASDHEKEEFLKEAVLMSNFKHEHILSLLGVCLDNDPHFLILELMEGGDLLSFLRACRPSTTNAAFLCLTDLVKICVHVARGCKYLEEMHFVHRDLAARNCLVSSKTPTEMVVKIGDFGLARDIYKNDYYRKEGEGLLPVRWMSPEALVDGVFTTQSDIWAFGVLMWEVMTFGRQPYPARTNIEVLHFVRSGGQLELPDGCPEDMFELMQSCWGDAESRPSFSSVLEQLEDFLEKCNALFADYIVPIRSRNVQSDAAGYTHRHRIRERSRASLRTSSLGHDPDEKIEDEVLYKKIHHATSFDTPEPHEATDAEFTCQRIAMQNSVCTDYLIPHTQGTPNYLEIIQDPIDRRPRKSSQGSSRHSSCSSDIYAHSLNSSLQVALPPLKQYESIHSIDSENQTYSHTDSPFTMVSSIPEGYEIVPYPSHLNKRSTTVPEGYSFVRGPPRQVHNKSNINIPEGYPSCQAKYISDRSIPVPSAYTMVNIPVRRTCPMGSSSSAEVVLDYPRQSVDRGCSSAEAKLYFTASPADVAKNMKNKPKHFYPFADSRNYVDCNRNKASYLSLSSKGSDCSLAHITHNVDVEGPLMYWASSNGSRHPNMQQECTRHVGRSRGQVYPVNEAVVPGYPDLHASLV